MTNPEHETARAMAVRLGLTPPVGHCQPNNRNYGMPTWSDANPEGPEYVLWQCGSCGTYVGRPRSTVLRWVRKARDAG